MYHLDTKFQCKTFYQFDICGSVHLGNMFISDPTRYTLYSLFLSSFALHVSGAICTLTVTDRA
jgi:hypothetical protein